MAQITGEVLIAAPITQIFDLVADERNEPRYNPRIARADKVTDRPIGAGARFVAEPKGMGRRGKMTMEIVEYERPRCLHNVVRSPYLLVDGTLTFEETGTGTRLRWDWSMVLRGPFRVLAPLLTLVGPAWERRNWRDLKKYVESRHR